MLKRNLILAFLLAGTVVSAAEKRPPIGTNVNGLSYWSTGLPFLDEIGRAHV